MNDDTFRAQTKNPYGFFKDLRGIRTFSPASGLITPGILKLYLQ